VSHRAEEESAVTNTVEGRTSHLLPIKQVLLSTKEQGALRARGRGLPAPLHSSVCQVPVLVKPQCMLLRNLGYPFKTSVQMPPGAAELKCALKGGKPLARGPVPTQTSW
jgi:hypothetical protein